MPTLEAVGLEIFEGEHAERDDQAAPEVCQLAMVALDADVEHILEKLGVPTRAGAVALAAFEGILLPAA